MTAWMQDRGCTDHLYLWFSHDRAEQQTAKGICNSCKVSEMCLEYALNGNFDDGIFGGMTSDERKSYQRRMQRARRRDLGRVS